MPAEVLEAADLLQLAGHRSHVVGGAVRDLLLGRTPHDWDLATSAPPETAARILADAGFRVIPTGLRYGTVTAIRPPTQLEVTTYRREAAYRDRRHPSRVAWSDRVEEDLARRDFTVNALAWDPVAGIVVDPFGGLTDLAPDRPLRTVGAAADRFAEDPLRILRLFRIAAALGKTPDAEAREAASRLADLAAGVAAERLGTELTQLLRLSDPSTGLRGLAACGVLGRLVPGFQACVGFDQRTPHHALTVDEHLIQTCARTPPRPVLRWAGLLHDLAKPACFTPDPRGGHFYGHDAVGAEMAAHAMERLRLPGVWTAQVRALVANHLFPWEEAGPAAYRRLLRRLGGEAAALDLVALTAADRAAQRGAPWGGEGAARLAIRREARGPVPLTARQLAVSGRDVMAALGIGPGPAVGEALRTLLEAVTEDPALNRRDLLLGLLRPRRAPAAAQDADRSTRSP